MVLKAPLPKLHYFVCSTHKKHTTVVESRAVKLAARCRLMMPKIWRKRRDHVWKRQFVYQ